MSAEENEAQAPEPDLAPAASSADDSGGGPTVDELDAHAETDLTNDGVSAEPGDSAESEATVEMSEDAVVKLIAERDEYLDRLQRLKAEFDNARRRNLENAEKQRRQAAADLVEKLLPVLDSCDSAVAQGVDAVAPIGAALYDVLAAQGLTKLDPADVPFDPEQHEAVMHEAGVGEAEPTVAETLRTGYVWNERVLRPAMVKVRG